MFPSPSRIHAPEINRPSLQWLNTSAPLGLSDFKGKLVLLDFWTFCCINCIQILPTLRKLEETFHKELVVIGVHTPKFEAEKDIENVRHAVARYDIRHPVIHDPRFELWGQYDVHAWPTMVFIDPHGYVIGKSAGEPDPLHLMNAVRDMIDAYEDKGALKTTAFPLAAPDAPASKLSFPGKIKPLAGQAKQWLVADSGHHQMVVFDDEGREIKRYGSGLKGCTNGASETASFNSPQGFASTPEGIYVADTGNHAIRRIDRTDGTVSTLCGTGERGHLLLNKFEKASERALASPWDAEFKHNILFFANAGTHQIGGIDVSAGHVRLVAGNGAEGLRDGNPLTAELAQPSSLALSSDGTKLFFADSETSSIRFLDMPAGVVRTLVGTGLFDFGKRNGSLRDALFQHPLGCHVLTDNTLVVADSYNNTIRFIHMDEGRVTELGDEDGLTCLDPICLPLAEPAGIWADGPHRLLVSDTNNHRIVDIRLDTKTTKTWA